MSLPFHSRSMALADLREERRYLDGMFDNVHRALFFSAIRNLDGKITWDVVGQLEELRDQWNTVARLEASLEPARDALTPMARVEWQILRDEQLELLVAAHNLTVGARASFASGDGADMSCDECLRRFQRLERAMFAHQSRRDDLRERD